MKQYFLCILAAFLILFGGCKQETSEIGLGLINEVGTDFTDTTSIVAYSFLEDTINTTNMSANVIGNIHDPVFGDHKGTAFAQFSMSGSSVNFGTNPVIDSVVLTLQISSYYGDTNSRVAFRVYQLTEPISGDKYYQNNSVSYDPTPLNYSLTQYSIQPNTHVIVDTNSYNPHLRIRLSQAFGQYLLNNSQHMTSNSSFQNFFKGICIDAISHSGSNGYMIISNLNSALTGINLYYHNDEQSAKRYRFSCSSSSCKRFNSFTHNYLSSSDANFTQEVLGGDREIGNSVLFVQAMGGVKTRVTFPYLKDAFKSLNNRVVINKAELVITNVAPDETFWVQPTNLTLQGISEKDGKIMYLPDDEYYTGATYFGGNYDATKHEYRFRITKYVQGLILQNSELSNSVNLVLRGSAVRANRLVFGGTGLSDNKRMRLELSYTTY